MEQTKLIALLRVCTGYELRRFQVFITSDYFNQYPETIILFNYLRALHPEFPEEKLNKKEVFAQIWPGESVDPSRLRYLSSRLCKLLETFWSVQSLMKDSFEQDRRLLETYHQRNLDKYFRQTLNRAGNELEKGEYRDEEYYFRQFMLARASHSYTIEHQNRELESSIEHLLKYLDTWYFSNKLKFACAAVNRQNILAVESDLGMLDEIQQFLSGLKEGMDPGVEIYLRILEFLREVNNEEAYMRLLGLLESHKNKFPHHELSVMYSFALNYCIRQLNLGKTAYLSQLFELYLVVTNDRLIFSEGQLPAQHFKNIVTVGLRLGRYGDIEKFIQEFAGYIPVSFRENARIYSHASIHFFKQEYGLALKLLQQVEFTDVFYHLDAKSLLLKTYYELLDPEPFFSLVDTFRIYLRRNRSISDYQRKIYRNLVRFSRWLMQAKLGDRRVVKKLKEEVRGEPEAADLRWLKEKMAEFNP